MTEAILDGSLVNDNNIDQVSSQLMSEEEAPIGSETILSVADEDETYGIPAVVKEPFAGTSWVLWEVVNNLEEAVDIFARRVAADGTLLADSFRVNQQTGLPQYDPFTVADAAGNVTVIWIRDATGEESSEPKSDIVARRFQAGGLPLGDEFVVNLNEGEAQNDSPVAGADLAGNLVVVWRRGQDMLFRLFSPTGFPRSEEIRVKGEYGNLEGTEMDLVEVTVDPLGGFTVRWTEFWESAEFEILNWYSRSFDTNGEPLSGIILESPTGDAEEY